MAEAKRPGAGTSWLLTWLSLFTVGRVLDRVSGGTLWQYVQIALFIQASGCIGASLGLHLVFRRTE